ncbi:MAG TPA: hypothetical protein VFC23_00425 [Thermoanaerobaculia bacterium]|nr:hypothetical protein [Thermoanaerobaculia bacterium]
MRKLTSSILAAALVVAAAPAFAGIHYKSSTKSEDGRGRSNEVQVEGWVAGEKARVEFKDSTNGNPVARKGTYLLTQDAGKTLYLVNPEDKTYAVWDLSAMLGAVGSLMNGMGPLLRIQFSEPRVEKVADEDGGTVAGLPTHHTKYRTSYTASVKVLGMGSTSNVVTEQDFWTTTKLPDAGLGVWLRAEPPRTGNADFDRLLTAEKYKLQGYPLKVVTVSTNTDPKRGRSSTTHSTMEVTQLDTSAAVPAGSFELPAGYKETQILPAKEGSRE